MATALPTFPEFDVNETSTQAARWKKWLSRFRNLLVAMNMTGKKRQRALLLHYDGEATNEIFDTLPNTTAGESKDPFAKAVQALQPTSLPGRIVRTKSMFSVKPSKKATRIFQHFTQG